MFIHSETHAEVRVTKRLPSRILGVVRVVEDFRIGQPVMSTKIQRDFRGAYHNKPLYYSVTERDTKPKTSKHDERMTEDEKKQMARDAKHYAEKLAAIDAEEASIAAKDAAIAARAIVNTAQREALQKSVDEARLSARAQGKIFQEPVSSLILVIRIKGINKMPPRPRKIMALLRLRRLNSAIFVRRSKDVMNMLNHVNPWVTFGTPTFDTVERLIKEVGYCRTGFRGHYHRVKIEDNSIVDEYIGKSTGIQGIDDLVHEIYNVGPNFTEAKRFMSEFHLNSPQGGYGGTKKHMFTEARGGAGGNREGHINKLAISMIH